MGGIRAFRGVLRRCVPPCRRVTFSCVAKKKSPKRRRPPRYAAGVAGCPALLGWPGGKHKLGATPLKQCSPTAPGRPPLLGAARGGDKAHRKEPDAIGGRYSIGSQLALCVVEQRKAQREKGRGLSEGEARVPQPPVAAEQRRAPGAAGRRCGRAFSLATFFWQDKRKYARRRGGTEQLMKR